MIPTACPTCSVPCLRNISFQPIAAVTRGDDIKQNVDAATREARRFRENVTSGPGRNALSVFTRVFDALWGVAARPGHESKWRRCTLLRHCAMTGSSTRAPLYHRHPEARAARRNCAVRRASKGEGPAASWPFILRGSQRSADALRYSHLRMTGL